MKRKMKNLVVRAYVDAGLHGHVPKFLSREKEVLKEIERALEAKNRIAVEIQAREMAEEGRKLGMNFFGYLNDGMAEAAGRSAWNTIRVYLERIRQHLQMVEVVYR